MKIILFLVFIATVSDSFCGESSVLQGRIVLPDGSGASEAVVILEPANFSVLSDSMGFFHFQDVPPGYYMLVIYPPSPTYDIYMRKVEIGEKPGFLQIVLNQKFHVLEEVVVTSSPIKEDDSNQFTTVIHRKNFESRARTVGEVLAAAPGVTVRSMGGVGSFAEISVRGANPNQVQILLDGMILNDASGGPVDLSSIPVSSVGKLEIWKSGSPMFSGTSPGGVINIETRELHSDNGFSAGYGSYGTWNANAFFGRTFGLSRITFLAGMLSSKNDFEFTSDNGTIYNKEDDFRTTRLNDGYRSYNLMAKYRGLIGTHSLLEISEHFISSLKEIPGRDIVQLSEASFDTKKNIFQTKLSFSHPSRPWFESSPNFHHILTREHYLDPGGRIGWGARDNLYLTNSYNFSAPLVFTAGQTAEFSLAPTIGREEFTPEYRIQNVPPFSTRRNRYSYIFESRMMPWRGRVSLVAKAGQEVNSSQFKGKSTPLNPVPEGERTDRIRTHHTGTRIALTRNISITGSYTDTGRMPGFYELFGDRGTVLPNPKLVPERVSMHDFGARFSYGIGGGGLLGFIEISKFRGDYRKLIQWFSNDAGFLRADNVGKSVVEGIEFVYGASWKGFSVNGNWTMQETEVTEDVRSIYVGKKLPGRPARLGGFAVEKTIGHYSISWLIDHKGSYFLDRVNQPHMLYPGRTLYHTTVEREFPLTGGTVSMNLLNIGDIETFDTRGMPLPGRAISVNLKGSINNH